MTAAKRRGNSDEQSDTEAGRTEPEAGSSEREPEQSESELGDTERAAVENATAEVLGGGARRDRHGEIVPDPYPDGDEDEPDTDVLHQHRRDAHAIQSEDPDDASEWMTSDDTGSDDTGTD